LRGFAKSFSQASSLFLFKFSKAKIGITTSHLISMGSVVLKGISTGIDLICIAFIVISSHSSQFPRVNALINFQS
jgi:hypothetical protein